MYASLFEIYQMISQKSYSYNIIANLVFMSMVSQFTAICQQWFMAKRPMSLKKSYSKFYVNFVWLLSKFRWSVCYQILHMTRQHSCRVMWKIGSLFVFWNCTTVKWIFLQILTIHKKTLSTMDQKQEESGFVRSTLQSWSPNFSNCHGWSYC